MKKSVLLHLSFFVKLLNSSIVLPSAHCAVPAHMKNWYLWVCLHHPAKHPLCNLPEDHKTLAERVRGWGQEGKVRIDREKW